MIVTDQLLRSVPSAPMGVSCGYEYVCVCVGVCLSVDVPTRCVCGLDTHDQQQQHRIVCTK